MGRVVGFLRRRVTAGPQGLIWVYRNDPAAAELCERLVDLDEGLQEWRYRHVKMVERTIGTKQGTGGSPGAAYLRSTLGGRCSRTSGTSARSSELGCRRGAESGARPGVTFTGGGDVVATDHDSTEISRRMLLAGGLILGAGAVATTLIVDPEAAEAKSVSDSTKRKYGAVTVIGDSSVIFGLSGLKTELKARNLGPFVCDARPARTLRGEPHGRRHRAGVHQGQQGEAAVVIALGGGDTGIFKHTSAQITDSLNKVLNALGSGRQIGLSTQWSPKAGQYAARFNNALYAAARRRSNVFVSDWASVVKRNQQWFGSDDAHYKTSGIKARNKFLADMALKAARRV